MVSAFEEFTDRPIPTAGSDRTHTKFRDGTKTEVIASAWQGQRRLQRRDVEAGKKQEFSKHTKGWGRRAQGAQGPARTKAWLIPDSDSELLSRPGEQVLCWAWHSWQGRITKGFVYVRSSLDFLFRQPETIRGFEAGSILARFVFWKAD